MPHGVGDTCTTSDNDLSNVSVGTLAIGDAAAQPSDPSAFGTYTLTGNALRVDRLVSTAGPTEPLAVNLDLPIILGRDQTWHLQNPSLPPTLSGRHALTIDLTEGGAGLPSDTEVGPLRLVGSTVPGQSPELSFSGGESVNGRDGQPVHLDGVDVFSFPTNLDGVNLSTGPLSISGAAVFLGAASGEGTAGYTATLNTEGTRLDAGSSLVFSLGSEIVSSGPVNLGGATLDLSSEPGRNESCGSVAAGTAYPIVSASGRVRGVLANALPGSTVQVGCGLYRLRYQRWPWLGTTAGVSAVWSVTRRPPP